MLGEDLKPSTNKAKPPDEHGTDEVGDVGLSIIFNHVTIFSIQIQF